MLYYALMDLGTYLYNMYSVHISLRSNYSLNTSMNVFYTWGAFIIQADKTTVTYKYLKYYFQRHVCVSIRPSVVRVSED